MLAIGVPSFAISFVKKMSEVRTVDPPEEPGGEWSVVVETGGMIICAWRKGEIRMLIFGVSNVV